MSYDLRDFGVPEMLRCGREVKDAVRGQPTLEEAAGAVVRHFHESFVDARDGQRQLVLARLYKTHPYRSLEPGLQRFAERLLGGPPADGALPCLTLLGTTGDEPAWCDRHRSRGHQAIPLARPEMVEQAPMIAQLVRALGLDVHDVVRPATPLVQTTPGRSFNVFHVEQATGSPYIPAQRDFVERYGVRSVVGFGGQLRTGNLFAVILFARAPISEATAERFRYVALDVKYALFTLDEGRVFAEAAARTHGQA